MILKLKINADSFKQACQKIRDAFNRDAAEMILKKEFLPGMTDKEIMFLLVCKYRINRLQNEDSEEAKTKILCWNEFFRTMKHKWGLDYDSIDDMPDLSEDFLAAVNHLNTKFPVLEK